MSLKFEPGRGCLTTGEAAEIIKAGGLVAVPTETVYGLASNALDEAAVGRIFEVKGRPEQKPLSVLVSGAAEMDRYCADVPPAARALAQKFWPGPLTIVLKAREGIPACVRAGGTTVGLRCPDHPLTLALLQKTGLPLAAPSANPSGLPSPKTAEEVYSYFADTIDGVLDGGECGLGVASTIIDLSETPYKILRRGALSETEIFDALAENLRVVGITGGSGVGKTTALGALREFGAYVIDCDALYHELLENDEALLEELSSRFPAAFTGGTLDRKTLGRIAFSDEAALGALNRAAHKYVSAALRVRLAGWARQGGETAAIDAVALFESGLDALCSDTVGILAPREDRINRIRLRENIDEEYAALRVDAQRPDDYFRERCGWIIENNGGRDEFMNSCRTLFARLLKQEDY